MKKTAAAAAVLACAGTASAQSSVTLFGVLDAGVSYYSATSSFYNNTARFVQPLPDVTKSQTVLSSSNTSPSRLGFRGTEDLGGGLAAGFWLEAAILNDTGAGGGPGGTFIFNRRSTVSLLGTFGEVRLGRDFTPTYWNDNIFSPFTTLGVGANVISTVGSNMAVAKGPGSPVSATDNYLRTSNSIGYFLPPSLGGSLRPTSICASRERQPKQSSIHAIDEGSILRRPLRLRLGGTGRRGSLRRQLSGRFDILESGGISDGRPAQRSDQDREHWCDLQLRSGKALRRAVAGARCLRFDSTSVNRWSGHHPRGRQVQRRSDRTHGSDRPRVDQGSLFVGQVRRRPGTAGEPVFPRSRQYRQKVRHWVGLQPVEAHRALRDSRTNQCVRWTEQSRDHGRHHWCVALLSFDWQWCLWMGTKEINRLRGRHATRVLVACANAPPLVVDHRTGVGLEKEAPAPRQRKTAEDQASSAKRRLTVAADRATYSSLIEKRPARSGPKDCLEQSP